jgi:hypothetical protein
LLAIPVFVLMGVMANWARRRLNATIDADEMSVAD